MLTVIFQSIQQELPGKTKQLSVPIIMAPSLFHALHPVTMILANKTSERFITDSKRIMKHGDTSILYGNMPVNTIDLAYFRQTRDGFIVLGNIYHRNNQSALERFIGSIL